MNIQGIPELQNITNLCLRQPPHLRATASSTEAGLRGLLDEIGVLGHATQTISNSDEDEGKTIETEDE
jgi:hypothetical protein